VLFAKMPQQENCLVVFESIPLNFHSSTVNTTHLQSSEAIKFLRIPFGNVIKCVVKIILHNQSWKW